jgi:sulfate adenylyltransferase subunit 2
MQKLDHLSKLEAQGVYIIREAFAKIENMGMLWSIGKDSGVLLWLARKAFGGNVPFPLIHIDTSYKMPEMIAFRDRVAVEWDLDLRVSQNKKALDEGMNHTEGRVTCCQALKTTPLSELVEASEFGGLIVGVRRDEQATRAKERYFSPRNNQNNWDAHDQPPEFWGQFNTDFAPGDHVRVHPLLDWTEVDIWEYIKREEIPVVSLYFANEQGKRYRSLGCAPCTMPIDSTASTLDEIITELRGTKLAERDGRAQDQESEDAFEQLRKDGYM